MKPHNREQITTIFNQIKKAMRKKQEKKDYSAPRCMIIQVSETTYLMDTSFPSQHKKANKASGPAAAKASQWDEKDFEDEAPTSWED